MKPKERNVLLIALGVVVVSFAVAYDPGPPPPFGNAKASDLQDMEGLPPSPPLRARGPEGWTTSARGTLAFSEEVEPVFPTDSPYDSLTAMIAVESRRA